MAIAPTTIAELLALAPQVDVYLLVLPPTSTDPATWQGPSWPGYQPANVPVVVRRDQLSNGGVAWSLEASWMPTGPDQIWGYGIAYGSQGIEVRNLDSPATANAGESFTLKVSGAAQPTLTL